MHKIVRYVVMAAVILLGLIAVVAAQNIQTDTAGDNADAGNVANPSPKVIGGDEAGLRALLARVIDSHLYLNQQPVVYVGGLPEKMPLELPLPDKTRLLGSIVYSDPGDIEILLDVSLTPDDLITFFHDSLTGDSWKFMNGYPLTSGFVSGLAASGKFCYNNGAASLTIDSQSGVQEATSQVQIVLNTPGSTYTCNVNTPLDPPFGLLPQLQTPDGVTLLPGNGSGSGGAGLLGFRSGSISALLYSTLPIQDIADAYNQELADAGWEAVDSEVGSRIARSGWTLKDTDGKGWAGTFILTANPAVEDQYSAQVMIQEIAAK